MKLTKSKPLDALGAAISPSALYRPLQAYAGVLDGVPVAFNRDVRLLGSHPAVAGHPLMWIPASTDDATAARLHNQAVYGQPTVEHEPLTREPKPIPTSRQMVVTRDFIAGAGTNLVKLVEGDMVDKQDGFFGDLVKQFPENFRPAGEAA